MRFHLTVRWGHPRIRYHQAEVEAPDLRAALVKASGALPEEVAASADLAELRPAPDTDHRTYLEG